MIRLVQQWIRNNNSPRLTVEAVVVSKCTYTTHHPTGDHNFHTTNYPTTFQVESGDRIEFSISGQEYGMLSEGDQGRLYFQGTRYLGFERKR